MKDGICPKCGSSDVYTGAYLGPWAKMGSYWANTFPITTWINATLDNYVCVNCGYVESYVRDRAKLHKITQKWPRAGGSAREFEALGARSTAPARTCPQCGRPLQDDWQHCPYCGQSMV